MAIALKLETREQTYNIYGGSAGFTKIIAATGLVDTELTTGKLLEVFSDLERRKAIVSILLDEGEFEPDPDFTERKKDAFVTRLAKQLDTGWIIRLIAVLTAELNTAANELSAAVPSITQEDIVEHIRQDEIARQAELPVTWKDVKRVEAEAKAEYAEYQAQAELPVADAISPQSNIAEGE